MKPILLSSVAALFATALQAQDTVPVTTDNFTRAESDLYMNNMVKDGGFGKFHHIRTVGEIDKQPIIRMNRDTFYSAAVFDLDAGPVTITMPDAGKRFMSMEAINEDHYVVGSVQYGAGSYTFDRQKAGTRYLLIAMRTFGNPNDPADVQAAHALQDAIEVRQQNAGSFEIPHWDQASQKKIRDALLVLGASTSGFTHAFGSKDQVDPIYHLIGTAMGWGGNPEKDATYVSVTPADNDGMTPYTLTVRDVPVDAFWSVSVYNSKGYFEKNPYDAYSFNSVTAKKDADGSATIQFGGCDGVIANCLPVTQGWNYTVRLYRPRAEILNGTWKFPEAVPQGAEARR